MSIPDDRCERLKVSVLVLDPRVQPRVELDQEKIKEYAQAWKDKAAFPPIVVYFDGQTYWLAGGFHRVHGAMLARVEEVPADIRSGTWRDAILYAVGTNATHGLPRSNADKRRAVMMLLEDEEWSQWSNRAIARQCAVSEFGVRKHRSDLSAIKSQIDSDRKVVRNGTTYVQDTSNIGKSRDIEPEPDREEPDLPADSSEEIQDGDGAEEPEFEAPEEVEEAAPPEVSYERTPCPHCHGTGFIEKPREG